MPFLCLDPSTSSGPYANNTVFSPYSNPPSYSWSGSSTNIAVEVTGTSGSNINCAFYVSSPISASPSKPFMCRIDLQANKVIWFKNPETDVSQYEVWRGQSSSPTTLPTSWTLKATVSDTFWVETDYDLQQTASQYLHYKVRAKDSQTKLSVYSSSLAAGKGSAYKEGFSEPVAGLPLRFALFQNHPNPFNPGTVIRYALPTSTDVTLTVYNLLGQEVRTLIQSTMAAGYHKVYWDGKDGFGKQVASGVYFYRLQTKEFTKANKMLLVT